MSEISIMSAYKGVGKVENALHFKMEIGHKWSPNMILLLLSDIADMQQKLIRTAQVTDHFWGLNWQYLALWKTFNRISGERLDHTE